jgi:hypothetical protein
MSITIYARIGMYDLSPLLENVNKTQNKYKPFPDSDLLIRVESAADMIYSHRWFVYVSTIVAEME